MIPAARLLLSSSDVFSLRWQGQSAVLSWMPPTRLQNAPANSCRICTSLNLIYWRPLWEQRSRPCPGSHAPIFTHTHTRMHTHGLARVFHFIESQAVLSTTFSPVSLPFHSLSLAHLLTPCSLFFLQHIPSLPNSLSFISHLAVAWYWECDDMVVLFLSSGWCIVNAYWHRHAATDLKC